MKPAASSESSPTKSEPATKEKQFHPYRLLMVIIAVSGILALISYGLQVYFLPDYF